MIVAAITDNVSLGNAITWIVVIAGVLSISWVYSRKESAAVWRSAAEGFEVRVRQLEELVDELKHDLDIEKSKPNQELLVGLVSKSLGSMAAVTVHVRDLSQLVKEAKETSVASDKELANALAQEREESSQAMMAMTTTMQHTGVLIQDLQKEVAAHEDRALERHNAAMQLFQRNRTERTRKTDNPGGK